VGLQRVQIRMQVTYAVEGMGAPRCHDCMRPELGSWIKGAVEKAAHEPCEVQRKAPLSVTFDHNRNIRIKRRALPGR
jgi:hypothetical protein